MNEINPINSIITTKFIKNKNLRQELKNLKES